MYSEDTSTNEMTSYALNVKDVADATFFSSWTHYKLNAVKVEYYPHQQRPIANPVELYSTFTPANIATSTPPMFYRWTDSPIIMPHDMITTSPGTKFVNQGSNWRTYRKLRLPIVTSAQAGDHTTDIELYKNPWISTADIDVKYGSFYLGVENVDSDTFDNNQKIGLGYTLRFTYYVSFKHVQG